MNELISNELPLRRPLTQSAQGYSFKEEKKHAVYFIIISLTQPKRFQARAWLIRVNTYLLLLCTG